MRDPYVDAAIKAAGGVAALGRLTGVKSQAVSQWDKVPLKHLPVISELIGKPATEIRPDVAALFPSVREPAEVAA